MYVNKAKYHVYQNPKADEYKSNLNMTVNQFSDRWN